MAKKEKPSEAAKWIERIDRAKKVKQNWRDKFRVDLAYEYWEGNQRPAHVPAHEWITVNKLFADMMAELPSLYSQNPEFYVKLRRSYSVNPMDVALFDAKASIRQAMLNYLKDELDLKPKSRLSIFDGMFQYGIVKLSHQVDWINNPNAGEPTGALNEQGEPILEPNQVPGNELYIIERLHPDDFLVDEDAGPLNYSWCAHKIKRRLEDVQKDKRFNADARNKVRPTETSEDEKDRETRKKGNKVFSDNKEPEPDIVILWEVWQFIEKRFFVVSEGYMEDYMLNPQELPPGIESNPFIDLRFILRDDSWYPYPPLSPKLDPQREISETRSKILTHRKRFNRKYQAFIGGLEDPEIELSKLEIGEDGTIVRTTTPQPAITPIQDAPLDMQVHTELAYLDRDFQEYGAGASQRGSGTGIDSATEAGIIEKRYMLREGDRQSLVAEFMTRIGRKLDQLVQANLTKEMAVKVRGPQGEYWELVKPTDYDLIAGEYECGVVVGSHTPQLPEIERAQALNFLSLVAQAPQIAMSPALMRYLGKLFNIHENELNLIIQELQQVFQMMQQAQMMQKGVGSQAGVAEGSRAQSALPGMALGINNIRGGL